MYHLGVIEAFSGTLKKTTSEQISSYEVKVDPELSERILGILETLNIEPPPIVSFILILLNVVKVLRVIN